MRHLRAMITLLDMQLHEWTFDFILTFDYFSMINDGKNPGAWLYNEVIMRLSRGNNSTVKNGQLLSVAVKHPFRGIQSEFTRVTVPCGIEQGSLVFERWGSMFLPINDGNGIFGNLLTV